MGNQIAVFIDFENIALWAEQEFLDFELTPSLNILKHVALWPSSVPMVTGAAFRATVKT